MGQSHPLNPKPDRPSFYVPSGMERLSASTSLAMVEKIGPSLSASAGRLAAGL